MLSHTIVQKLNGLKYISPLLQSTTPALQNSAVALLGNLSREPRTNKIMGKWMCAITQGGDSCYCLKELHHGWRSVRFYVLTACLWLHCINVAFLSLCVIIARCCHYVVSGLVLFLTQCCVIWCFWCSVCFAVVLMNVFVGEARQTLPQLVGFLNTGLMKGDSSPEHDSTIATALHSAHTLMKSDPDIGKSLLNNKLINSLNSMSLNLWVHTS